MVREMRPAKPESPIRKQLMQAALKLFTQKGYSATTVRELVEAAGVTKPVLYYYFRNKEDLFLELMQTHFGIMESLIDHYRQEEGNVWPRLTELLDRLFLHVRGNRDFIRLLHAVYYGPPQGAPFFDFDAYHTRFHGILTQIMAEGIRNGEFRPGNASDMAWIIAGTVGAVFEDQICKRAAETDQDTLRRLLNLIFQGLTANITIEGKGI